MLWVRHVSSESIVYILPREVLVLFVFVEGALEAMVEAAPLVTEDEVEVNVAFLAARRFSSNSARMAWVVSTMRLFLIMARMGKRSVLISIIMMPGTSLWGFVS